MFHNAYIGIGSNLGNKTKNCEEAVQFVSKLSGTKILAVSKWHRFPALTLDPKEKQPDYINGALKIETELEPDELFESLQKVEQKMGRKQDHQKWAPRIIDLDILFYDSLAIQTEKVTIPHPELHKRIFVLKPLYDIEPELLHPVFGITVEKLLNQHHP